MATCSGKTAKGRKCKANSVKGSRFCLFHTTKKQPFRGRTGKSTTKRRRN